jgi:hypothetical protein
MEIQLDLTLTPYYFPEYRQKRSVAVPLLIGMGIFTALGMWAARIGTVVHLYQKLSREIYNDFDRVADTLEALQQDFSLVAVVL